jgi:Cu+-exporting ATPase
VVREVISAPGGDPSRVLALAAAVERQSEHPLAEAVVRHARERGVELAPVDAFQSTAGRGVSAAVGTEQVLVGSEGFLGGHDVSCASLESAAREQEALGRTVIWVAAGATLLGVIAVADALRPGARQAVQDLRDRGLEVVLLTGDNERTALAVAAEVGIDRVRARVLPSGKADEVARLQDEGRGLVAMVGDGINDAPALARADVGIAMGTGTDVAMETADVTLVSGDLGALPRALGLGRATLRTIRENLWWAFAYNVVLIPVAAGVLYPLESVPDMLRSLHPILAALAMAFSSVSVVLNSLRLKRARI